MTDDELIKAVVQEVMGWSATATHYPESVVKRDCGGTTTMDKCPFCGAEKSEINDLRDGYKFFKCLSWKEPTKIHQSMECKDIQIANLKERIEAWRNMWEECMRMTDKYNMEMYPEVQKLKELGEI